MEKSAIGSFNFYPIMSSLGALWYTLGIKDMTDSDLKQITQKLNNLNVGINLTPKILREMAQDAVPKGVKIELDPKITQDGLTRAAEGKTMRVEVIPLLTQLRKALKDATAASPAEIEVGVQETKLRNIINNVLHRQGYMININTVDDNYTKVVQQKLNGRTYTVKIHADAKEITRSVQASLMQVQSRNFGLQVSKDILRKSIDDALLGKPFNIQIAVMHDQARRAVQNALNNARMVGKDDALAYQRLMTGELKAAQAELARLKAAHQGATSAANAHASASINLGGALGSNIKIAGELGAAMGTLYSVHAIKQFLSQVIEIGGELEHQKIALETIYGTPSKMESLYGQIKGLARQSPFGVMELTKNIKQLSAYGVAYNEVYDTAKRLADISAATSVDIQRLILAFGKTKNRTFLDGLEAKQFAYANIPIYDALSKKLTELEGKFVSVKDVMGRIKKREIGFDMVKEILWDMTDEGGKFYNMQEKLAGSVKTSWKLVRDNIDLMFGEIAEGSVGSGLKSIAEILQKVTREWKTLASVIGAGAIAFGTYKIAVLAHNVVAGQSIAVAAKQHASLKMSRYHANLAAQTYRTLTQAEEENYLASSGLAKIKGINVLWSKKLNAAEASALLSKKLLKQEDILRLVALKKLTVASAEQVLITKSMTAADVAETKAQIARAAAAKRSTVVLMQIKAGLAGIVSTLWTLTKAAVPMALIGAFMTLWQKNSDEMAKAKEIGDNLFTKAVDGADSLKKTLEGLKPSSGLSSLELTQGIEKMQEAIKDYSPTPIKDINDALYTQDGLLRPLAERYEELKRRLEELKETFDTIADKGVGDSLKNAIDASNGGWFDDDVNTDAKDYDAILKKREQRITKYIAQYSQEVKRAVDEAASKDTVFAQSIDGMNTYSQKFAELVRNQKKYATGFYYASQIVEHSLQDIFDVEKLQGSWEELSKEMDVVWNNLNADAKLKGMIGDEKTIKDATEVNKEAYAVAIRDWINGLEVSDEVKQKMLNYYSDLLKFDFETFDAQSKIVGELNKGLELEVGKAIFEKIKNGLKLTPEEQEKFDKALQNIYLELYKKIPDAQKKAFNNAVASEDRDGNWIFDNKKMMSIQAKLNVRADWQEWQREIDDATGNLKPIQAWIKGASDVESFVKAVQDGYKSAKSTIDKLKPLMLKAGIEFNFGDEIYTGGGSLYQGMTDAQRQIIDEYNEAVRAVKAAQKAGGELGFDPKAESEKEKDSKGTQKDEFAESLKQRFKDIKDAWSEFQKWTKTEGKEAAANRIADSGLFSTLSKDEIPKTVEQYRALVVKLEEELKNAGVEGHSQRESLLNDILKQLLDIDKTVVDEQLKLALDKVSKEAERQLADWNLFDKIRKATGNQELAMSIAFGLNADAETDYPKLIEQQLDKQAKAYEDALAKKTKGKKNEYSAKGYTYASLQNLYDKANAPEANDEDIQAWMGVPEEIRKAWEKANSDIIKYFDQQKDAVAGVLSEYQTLQDKIDAINAKRKDDLEKISRRRRDEKGNELSEYIIADAAERKRLADLVNSKADWDIFRQSNDYLRFFSTIYSYTLSEAQNMGMLIEQYLNRQLQNAQISAEEYGKEMERVRGQIEKLRNVKSPFMTFFTDGANGYLDQRLNQLGDRIKADPKLSKELFDYRKKEQELTEQIAKAQKEGDKDRVNELKKELKLLRDGLSDAVKGFVVSDKFKNVLSDINKVVAGIDNVIKGVSDAFDSIRGMADSFGFDTESNGWLDMGAVIDTFSQVSSALQAAVKGDIGGIISGVVSAVTSPFSIWNRLHDKKLDKMIEKSKEAAQIMQNQYDILEKQMANFLGNAAAMKTGVLGGGYGKQRQLMQGQLTELEKQRQAEIDKKKTDNSVVEDYNQQIEEMKIQIRDFAIEVAKDLYGIDLNGWAEQLGDSLVDAFAAGEDAAEAFDKTVGDIMRDVTSKMISQDILAPMFGDLRNFLFGTDGMSGAFGADFKLDPSEMGAMKEYLDKIKDEGIPAAQDLFDAINDATGGLLNDTEKSKNGATAGLQSLTENTGDLLASYLNGVRGDVSVVRLDWDKLVENTLPEMNIIAEAQLTAQRQIAENTLRTAEAAEAINSAMATVTKNQDRLERSWRRIAEKNWGTY